MAAYKVLQDIEAEDKLIGPLTLRQCIYAAIALTAGWLSFLAISKHVDFLVIPLLPFIGFGVFFAFPWKAEQSTEVWALAKIRFMLKPRKRIWDQSGLKQLVDINVPKAVEDPRHSRRLSETEVRSRLHALADTIDSRGWAVKNAPIDLYSQPADFGQSDRLIQPTALPRQVPTLSEGDSDDMFDPQNSPLARQLQQKMNEAAAAQRQGAVNLLTNPVAASQPAQDHWYGTGASGVASDEVIPGVTNTADAFAAAGQPQAAPVPQAQPSYAHLRTIQPLSAPQQPAPAAAASPTVITPSQPAATNPPAAVTPPVNPAILELANNNDLNVATIAREARQLNSDSDGEVIVSFR